MVDANYKVQTGIEVNPSAVKQYMQADHNPLGGVAFSGFDKALGTASDWIGAVGPGVDALLGGHVTAKAITNGTVSAFYGQGGGFTPGIGGGFGSGNYGPTPGFKALNAGQPGTAPGYTGSSSGMSGAAGGLNPVGQQDISQFDAQINSMMNNNLLFLGIQTKVQNVSQITQLMSNVAKADSDAKLNAVRNVRS